MVCNVYSRRSHDSRAFRVSWRQETESPPDQNHRCSSYFSCKWPVNKLCKVWWCTMITLKTTILRMMIEQWKLIWFHCSSHHRVVCKNIIYEDPRSCKSLCSLHGTWFTWSIMVFFLCFSISTFLQAVSFKKVLDSILTWHLYQDGKEVRGKVRGRFARRGNAADMAGKWTWEVKIHRDSVPNIWQSCCSTADGRGTNPIFVAIYYMYHRWFYHIFTLKYVQIDTFETSIYIRLYIIYIYSLSLQNVLHL